MASPQMVETVQNLSEKLGQAVDILDDGLLYKSVPKPSDLASFLFELKVLFSLLDNLGSHDWTVSIENKKNKKFLLPRSPGKKENFSYFRIVNKKDGTQWDLVHGTQIQDPHNEKRAPDISLQSTSSGNDPNWEHVVAIWDAKFRGELDELSELKLSDSEYRSFVWLKNKLRVPRPNTNRDPLEGWPAAFEVSSLITNGTLPTESKTVLLEDSTSVVAKFKDANTPTFPPRNEHV